MTGSKYEPRLHGWDDERVYFIDEAGVEWCVSGHADLVARLVEICRDYFAQKAAARVVDDYFPLMDRVADRIEDLEDTIFTHFDESSIQTILGLKKDLLRLRRAGRWAILLP